MANRQGQKNLALFFTCEVSLKTWEQVGNLEREIKPYKELSPHFGQVYFFTYGSKDGLKFQHLLPQNIKILPKKYPLPSVIYSFLLPFLYRKILRQADVLKTNQMSGSWSAVIAKWLYKKKLVIRCGYEWLNIMEKEKKAKYKRLIVYLIEKIAYKSADKIIFTSFKDKEFALRKFKIPLDKVVVIPNYIDTELFKPFFLTPGLAEFNSARHRQGIIYVGRLAREKNLFNLVKAVSALPVKLVIVGDGPLKQELQILAMEGNADVEFKGRIANKELPKYLNDSGVFILPSFYEGSPKALLEAMACQMPCIVTNVEGIDEIIQHKENGYLCQTDADSIKKAISEVLEDNVLREQIGRKARETITNSFSLERILEEELTIYRAF